MVNNSNLSRNLSHFRENLARTAQRCGRNPDEITVIAVTKTQPLETVLEAASAGLTEIGENRVQEAERKYAGRERQFRLHLIGHLQSNKVRQAVRLFDVIQSVDSLKIASLIDSESGKVDKQMQVMMEVNTGGESQKFGFTLEDTLKAADNIFRMKNLSLIGLMTVAPFTSDESQVRGAFRRLKELFEVIKRNHPEHRQFQILSMGMSDDYELAIAEGATMLRIGRAIFGERG